MKKLFLFLSFFIYSIVHADNQLEITLTQDSPISVLKLESYYAPNIIWKDNNGNDTELAREINDNSITPFYGMDGYAKTEGE